jgi:hypothetical protein
MKCSFLDSIRLSGDVISISQWKDNMHSIFFRKINTNVFVGIRNHIIEPEQSMIYLELSKDTQVPISYLSSLKKLEVTSRILEELV